MHAKYTCLSILILIRWLDWYIHRLKREKEKNEYKFDIPSKASHYSWLQTEEHHFIDLKKRNF